MPSPLTNSMVLVGTLVAGASSASSLESKNSDYDPAQHSLGITRSEDIGRGSAAPPQIYRAPDEVFKNLAAPPIAVLAQNTSNARALELDDPAAVARANRPAPLPGLKVGEIALINLGRPNSTSELIYESSNRGNSAKADFKVEISHGQSVKILEIGESRSRIEFLQDGDKRLGWVDNKKIRKSDVPLTELDDPFAAQRAAKPAPLPGLAKGEIAIIDLRKANSSSELIYASPLRNRLDKADFGLEINHGQKVKILAISEDRSQIEFLQDGKTRQGWVDNAKIKKSETVLTVLDDPNAAARANIPAPLPGLKRGDIAIVDLGRPNSMSELIYVSANRGSTAKAGFYQAIYHDQKVRILTIEADRSKIEFLQNGQTESGWVSNKILKKPE